MIYITGSTGMIGQNLCHLLNTLNLSFIEFSRNHSVWYHESYNIKTSDVIVHLAGKVGGIFANQYQPFEFYEQNVELNNAIIRIAVDRSCRLITMSSTCIYPEKVPIDSYPLTEDQIFSGKPEPTNKGYAEAKRTMHKALEFADEQYGLNFVNIISGNLYGPYDHFRTTQNHVIPALIEKIDGAKKSNQNALVQGDGLSLRQFTYVEDLCQLLVKLVDSSVNGHYNFASIKEYSIMDLTTIIADIVNFEGKVNFSGTNSGQAKRTVSNRRLLNTGLLNSFKFTELTEGIEKTYGYYLETYERSGDNV